MAKRDKNPLAGCERLVQAIQHSNQPIVLISRSRRIQYVNAAWEGLTNHKAEDAIGHACVRSGRIEPLFRTLAPPRDALQGQVVRVRRSLPGAKGGPPWWDITFVPFTVADGVAITLGLIAPVQAIPPIPPRKIPAAVASIREQQAARYSWDLFAGESLDARRLLAQMQLAAATLEPVWIVGEPGSGKETAARVIHHHSANRERAFVVCECEGVQPYLLDSILFGIAGLATAGRIGTLVLNSPAVLPRDAQQRILDWLRIAPYPPRVICTSTRTAAEDVASGALLREFRADYSTLELTMLTLRQRREELPRIIEVSPFRATPEAIEILLAHDWPGNLRELFDVLADAAEHAAGEPIAPEHLARYVRERALIVANPLPPRKPMIGLDAVLEAVERRMIESALRKCRGNQTEAAAQLGIFRTRLGRRIEALKINVDSTASPSSP